jgi:sulfur carrier protein ThiS
MSSNGVNVQAISYHNGGQVLDVEDVGTVADVAQKLELSMENVVMSVNDTPATAGTQLTNGAVVQFQKQSVKSGI